MKKTIALIVLSLFCLQCAEETTGGTHLNSGTSFGECAGYCVRDLQINADSAVYTVSSWDASNYPELRYSDELTTTEWDDLLALMDLDLFQAYDDVIGCPDCADGGAEWIQVIRGDFSKTITFEYGDTLVDLQPLIDKVRDLRNGYEGILFQKE